MEDDRPHWVFASSKLLIEQCDDGSLVFDPDTGATTLLNDKATALLRSLHRLDRVAEVDLCSAMKHLWGDVGDFPVILALLEESRLVFRC
jgi:hypothetical protein